MLKDQSPSDPAGSGSEAPARCSPSARSFPAPGMAGCGRCEDARLEAKAAASGNWYDALATGMMVCPECGNKRCPRAAWHGNACTGSNEPGQPGSAYPAINAEDLTDPFADPHEPSRP